MDKLSNVSYGKVAIINTLLGSLFVYKLQVMQNMTKRQIADVEKMFREFLWHNWASRISHRTLENCKEHGGPRLCNIAKKQDCLKIAWIFKIEEDNLTARCVYEDLEPTLHSLIWRCNLSTQDTRKEFASNSYWHETLIAWCKVNYRDPQNKAKVLDQIIWRKFQFRNQRKNYSMDTLT